MLRVRITLTMALAAMLSGCAMLNSEAPLIAQSDPAAGVEPGTYQSYQAFGPRDARKLERDARADCIDAGYSRPELDARDWPTGRRIALIHCPRDPDTHQPTPPFRIEKDGDGYRLLAPPGSELAEGEPVYRLRFERLGDGLLAVQYTRDPAPPPGADGSGAVYGVVRKRGGDFEVLFVPCDSGMNPVADNEAATVPPGRGHRQRKPMRPYAPPPVLKCEVTSLDVVRPALRSYGEAAGNAPLLILRRTGD